MALGIPLPGQPGEAFMQGANLGSTLLQRMIQPKLAREKMGLDWRQHQGNLALKQAEEQRLAQLLPYQIQQYENANALQPYTIQDLMAKVAYHQAQADALKFDQDLLSQMRNGEMPSLGMNFSGNPENVNLGNQENPNTGISPLFAGLLKKRLGIDVYAESPQMKEARELRVASAKESSKQSEKYRAQNLEDLENASNFLSEINQAKTLLGEPGSQQYDYATSALGPLDAKSPAIRKGTRQFRGEFERLAGRMKSNIARLEKGATSDKERAMIDRAEISMDDSWTAAQGKLLAQEKYLNSLIKRKSIIDKLMEDGYSRSKALEIARGETPFPGAEESKSSSQGVNAENANIPAYTIGGKTFSGQDIKDTMRDNNMTYDDVISELNRRYG